MNQPGIGVMIKTLGGNERTVKTVELAIGKTIKNVFLDKDSDELKIIFTDGSGIKMWDGGQSCCERRYMKTDDDLKEYTDTKLLDIELKNAPDQKHEYGEVHEIQFLDVKTDKGTFQMSNHNEHNGYYGGFWIEAAAL